MGQSATVLANTAGQHQPHNGRAVDQVVVIPVIDTGSNDDGTFTIRLFGGIGELTGEVDHSVFIYP